MQVVILRPRASVSFMRPWWNAAILLAEFGCLVSSAQTFSGPESYGRVTAAAIDQASGLATGIRNPQVLWTHNDQTEGKIYALGTNAMLLGIYQLSCGVEDIEDIAVSTLAGEESPKIYVGDLGNNYGGRETVRVIRFAEPDVRADGFSAPIEETVTKLEVFTLRYPDGSYNSEPLLIDPFLGKLYILTKTGEDTRIYSADIRVLQPGATNLLHFEGEIYFPWLTAGTVSRSGRFVALRSAGRAALWERRWNETLVDALRRASVSIPVAGPPQEENGEGITFSLSDDGYFTISEGGQAPLYFFRRTDTPSLRWPHAPTIRQIKTEF